MDGPLSRRGFLSQGLTGISAVWLSSHWPALLSAATHAHQAAKAAAPPKFEFFTPEEAVEIDAITARIIPTTDTPGAHEAGVVYFMDRALVTFFAANQKTIRDGLPDLQAHVRELFPGIAKFSSASAEQQDQILQSLDQQQPSSRGRRGLRSRQAAQSFFETVRVSTIAGFLIDPDSDKRGNRDGVGWRVVGRDPSHVFQPPFGYYDKDYPGWQPSPSDADKAKS
ncbi:MAG TPA: gluconate 2-dehydrogenase subunit 3 family protein [Candidatus Methylomirabilis sp.]|nr:gluconate 2-dehydrogenase subunit 3 family protein [Candidatus Methylomirabilis sp.]